MEKEKYIISFSESDGISNLDTYPQMTADALKRQFDQKSDKLKDAHNALVERVAAEFEAEAEARGEAIAKETEERNKALSTEAEARSAAIAKETEERNKALSTEAEARDEALKLKADAQTEQGGFVAGQNAVAEDSGVAIGGNAKNTGWGAALGTKAESRFGGAVGGAAKTNDGGAVGRGSVSGDGFAGGSMAKAIDSDGNGIDAIQLGTGTNNKEKTLMVYGYRVTDYEKGSFFLAAVGNLAALQTKNKDNIVGAINELVSGMGDVDSALAEIRALQDSYIGGES